MIAANVAAARFLQRRKIPGLYRIHQKPSDDKFKALRTTLHTLGIQLKKNRQPTPVDYAEIMNSLAGRDDAYAIQTLLLRSLSQAVYSPENFGHFGLALDSYSHFTSPIRRYPDLLVHRAIRYALRHENVNSYRYSEDDMTALGEHCSSTERRADEATRDAIDWLKCEFMLGKVGDTFHGVVSGITGFGLFLELKEVFVEGLLHVTSLPNDYYHFDPVSHAMKGERSGRIYRLGDELTVTVSRVDLDERKIDFELVSQPRRKR